VTLDLRRFDAVTPTVPSAEFPWPRQGGEQGTLGA